MKTLIITSLVVLGLVFPANVFAQPKITEVGYQNHLYLPYVGTSGNGEVVDSHEQCNMFNPISKSVVASGQCVKVEQYEGATLVGGHLTTVLRGDETVGTTDLPSFDTGIKLGGFTFPHPITGTLLTATKLKWRSVQYIEPEPGFIRKANQFPVYAGRVAWLMSEGLQQLGSENPNLFPVFIATPHYFQPTLIGPNSTIFTQCFRHLQPVQLTYPGYPYDVIASDASTGSGNMIIAMYYPGCPEMWNAGYRYITFMNFWNGLKTSPAYASIEAKAEAYVQNHKYSTLMDIYYNNETITTNSLVMIVSIGSIVFMVIQPESAKIPGSYVLYASTN